MAEGDKAAAAQAPAPKGPSKLNTFAAQVYKPNTDETAKYFQQLQGALGFEDPMAKYGFIDPVDRYKFEDPLAGIMKKIDYKSGYISPDFQRSFIKELGSKAPTYFEQPKQVAPTSGNATQEPVPVNPTPLNDPEKVAAEAAARQAAEQAAKESEALNFNHEKAYGGPGKLGVIGQYFQAYGTGMPSANRMNTIGGIAQNNPLVAQKLQEFKNYGWNEMKELAVAKQQGRDIKSVSQTAQNMNINHDIWKWL